MKILVKKLKDNVILPGYATTGSAGMDLRACIESPIVLNPLERRLIPTGLSMALLEGCEGQIRPRSGLAIKYGVTVINSPGTLDKDFTGEICVILVNLSNEPFVINNGDRIAQMVIAKYERCEFEEVDELPSTERGSGGFGSTGLNN